jgi:hypothetical protein
MRNNVSKPITYREFKPQPYKKVVPISIQAILTSQTQLETKSMHVGKKMNLVITLIHEHIIKSHHYGPSEILM